MSFIPTQRTKKTSTTAALYTVLYSTVLGYEKQKRQRGGGGGVMGGGGGVMAARCVRFSKHNCVAAVV